MLDASHEANIVVHKKCSSLNVDCVIDPKTVLHHDSRALSGLDKWGLNPEKSRRRNNKLRPGQDGGLIVRGIQVSARMHELSVRADGGQRELLEDGVTFGLAQFGNL